jgi:prefoldin subunit 5
MDGKLMLCCTSLEEIESQLVALIREAAADDARAAQLTNALSHVRKAIKAINSLERQDRAKGKSAGGS